MFIFLFMQKRGVLYIGIDESNHGRYPEIYVAVFYQYPQDASPVIGLKKNRNKGNLDLILKDADGLQVYREIKKELPKVTIVVITGNIQKALELKERPEMAGCLYKPFEIEHILECIDKLKALKK